MEPRKELTVFVEQNEIKNDLPNEIEKDLTNETNNDSSLTDRLPPELWEYILGKVDCLRSRCNFALAFGETSLSVLELLKRKEVELYKRRARKIPSHHCVEILKMATNKNRIESYVYFWKYSRLFEQRERVSIKEIKVHNCCAKSRVTLHSVNSSGRWILVHISVEAAKTYYGFQMIHLDCEKIIEKRCPCKVDKLYLAQVECNEIEIHPPVEETTYCWCSGDLAHDCIEIIPAYQAFSELNFYYHLLQTELGRNFQPAHINLHSFEIKNTKRHSEEPQHRNYYLLREEFKLSFSGNFSFESKFYNRVMRHKNHLLFEGDTSLVEKQTIVCDVSISSISKDGNFKALFFLFDQIRFNFHVVFWLYDPPFSKNRIIPSMFRTWLFQGTLLIGITAEGILFVATIKRRDLLVYPATLPVFYFTCVCFRINLLVLGTETGQLFVYHIGVLDELFDVNLKLPDRVLNVAQQSIVEIVFIESSHRPEILVRTKYKLYRVTF